VLSPQYGQDSSPLPVLSPQYGQDSSPLPVLSPQYGQDQMLASPADPAPGTAPGTALGSVTSSQSDVDSNNLEEENLMKSAVELTQEENKSILDIEPSDDSTGESKEETVEASLGDTKKISIPSDLQTN